MLKNYIKADNAHIEYNSRSGELGNWCNGRGDGCEYDNGYWHDALVYIETADGRGDRGAAINIADNLEWRNS